MLLVIQSFGAKLAVKDGLFEVTTIQNKQYTKQEYAVTEVSSIWVQHGCSMTNAAINLALAHDIDFLLLDHFGMPTGRFTPIRPNSIITIQRAQLALAEQPLGLWLIKTWIDEKMQRQGELLQKRSQHHNSKAKHNLTIQKSIEQLQKQRVSLASIPESDTTLVAHVADTIRGIEGTAGRFYFAGLSALLPEKYPFEGRTYQLTGDAFNTCLNYSYAILYSKVEQAVTKAGLNPYIGILHRDDYQHKAFVYDFVEPYRYWAEEAIMSVFLHRSLTNSHLETLEDGRIWLSATGRRLIAEAVTSDLATKIDYKAQQVTRERYLLFQAQNLATRLLEQYEKVPKNIGFAVQYTQAIAA